MNGPNDKKREMFTESSVTPSPYGAGELKPFIQGDLDGLCGLYSLINSARYASHDVDELTGKAMFEESMLWLQANGYLPQALYSGIPVKALLSLHGRVIRRRMRVLKLSRPFLFATSMTDDEFWAEMAAQVAKPLCALMVRLFSSPWSHWTVISRITLGQVHLFDSGDLVWIRRRSCTCSRDRPGMFFIDHTEVFLIEAEKAKAGV